MVMVGGKNTPEMQGTGPGPAGGGITNGQPATENGAAAIGTGTDIIFTRGFGAEGIAVPPWLQVTLHCMFNKNPGIT
jgi:hypothetical protein